MTANPAMFVGEANEWQCACCGEWCRVGARCSNGSTEDEMRRAVARLDDELCQDCHAPNHVNECDPDALTWTGPNGERRSQRQMSGRWVSLSRNRLGPERRHVADVADEAREAPVDNPV